MPMMCATAPAGAAAVDIRSRAVILWIATALTLERREPRAVAARAEVAIFGFEGGQRMAKVRKSRNRFTIEVLEVVLEVLLVIVDVFLEVTKVVLEVLQVLLCCPGSIPMVFQRYLWSIPGKSPGHPRKIPWGFLEVSLGFP